MKTLIFVWILIFPFLNCFSQDWGDWIDVGHEIQVSFKFSNKGCNGYTYARIRNVSNTMTFCNVRISFSTICNNGNSGQAAVSAYNIGPGTKSESSGNWYNVDKVSNIRLSNLTDINCNDLLSYTPTSGGANEIIFEKKRNQQEIEQKNEEMVNTQRLKLWQEQERQNQEILLRQNEAANFYRQQQNERQQELQQQKIDRENALREKAELEVRANNESLRTINNSIEEAFKIIQENYSEKTTNP